MHLLRQVAVHLRYCLGVGLKVVHDGKHPLGSILIVSVDSEWKEEGC